MKMAASGICNIQSHSESIAVNDAHSLEVDDEVERRQCPTGTTGTSTAPSNAITSSEVPLNTPWSFWIDKYDVSQKFMHLLYA